MTALRSPLRSPLQPALRGPLQVSSSSGDIPALNLPFSSLANSTGSDARSAGWWNLMRGGNNVDEYIDATTGALTYGAHNLALQSNNFLATWFAQGVAVSTAATAGPARAPVATKISADAASTIYHGVRQGFSLVAGQKYTFSFFARQNGVNRVMLYEDTNVGWWSIIDLSSGAVVANHLGAVGAVVADEQGGRLCTVTVTATTTGVHVVYVKPLPSAQIDNSAYSGNSVDGIDIAAFQLNLGSTALTYVPTTTAPIYSLNPRITYFRASLATRIGPTGNVEYGPHNLFLRSEAFDNASWNANASGVTANATAAPDGQTTADKLLATTAAEQKWFYQSVTVVSGSTYTASVLLKAGEYQYSNIRIFTGGKIADIGFDLSGSGSIYNTNTGSGTITSVGNGWYRCSVSGVTSGTTAITYINANRTAVLSESFAGDGTSGLFVWGAQLNLGPLQPYYPTTSAAYYGPRFTHDPATLAPLGFLPEGQATNLISTNMANWVEANTTPNPVTEDANNWWGFQAVLANTVFGAYINGAGFSFAASTTYTLSALVDKGTSTQVVLGFVDTAAGFGGGSSVFVFGAGAPTITNRTGRVVGSAKADNAGNWLLSVTFTTQAAPTYHYLEIVSDGTLAAGTTFKAKLPQLEVGSAYTSRIPNPSALGTSMTRLADSALMTGTDFSSWYVTTQGVLLFTARIPAGDGYLFSVSDNTANNRISVRKSSGNLIYEVLSGGATQASISVAAPTVGTTAKIAVSFIANLFSFAVNGTAGTDDTAGTVPTVSRLTVGSDHTPANHWNESAALTRYFRTAFTAAKLQAITR